MPRHKPGHLRACLLCIAVIAADCLCGLAWCELPAGVASETVAQLKAQMTDVFLPSTDGAVHNARFAPGYDSHNFAWAIALNTGAPSQHVEGYLLRRAVLVELLRTQGFLVPGDTLGICMFSNQIHAGGTTAFSIVSDEFSRQQSAVTGSLPGAPRATQTADSVHADAVRACYRWLADCRRSGMRHLAFLLLTDPSLSGALIAYDVASRPAELGLPPVSVRKVAITTPTGTRGQVSPVRLAAVWAVFDSKEDAAADRLCPDGAEQGRQNALKQLAHARGYIRGRLVDASGNPTSAEWVTAGRGLTVASSARDGTYCIEVPSLGNYIVRPLSPDRVAIPHAHSVAISEAEPDASQVNFVLRPSTGQRVVGMVAASPGPGCDWRGLRPASRAVISVRDRSGAPVIDDFRTDRFGVFSLHGLQPSDYVLTATKGEHKATSTLHVPANGMSAIMPLVVLEQGPGLAERLGHLVSSLLPVVRVWLPGLAILLAFLALVASAVSGRTVIVAPTTQNGHPPSCVRVDIFRPHRLLDASGEPVAVARRHAFGPVVLHITHPGARLIGPDGAPAKGRRAAIRTRMTIRAGEASWIVTPARAPSKIGQGVAKKVLVGSSATASRRSQMELFSQPEQAAHVPYVYLRQVQDTPGPSATHEVHEVPEGPHASAPPNPAETPPAAEPRPAGSDKSNRRKKVVRLGNDDRLDWEP